MEESKFRRSVRLSETEQDSLLKKLDHQATLGAKQPRRQSPRIEYRAANVAISITHPGGTSGRFLVSTRNLSAGGMGFLHGGFLHQETEVGAVLRSINGDYMVVRGRVVMCRHVEKNVHEIGVAFFEKLDPALFVDTSNCEGGADKSEVVALPTIRAECLCHIGDNAESERVSYHLRAAGADPIMVDHPGALLDMIKRQTFDIVVVDIDHCKEENPIAALRNEGYKGPVLALTMDTSSEAAQKLETKPNLTVFGKPYEPVTLLETIAQLAEREEGARPHPIYSAVTHNPEMIETVNQYINQVQSTLRTLRDAAAQCDDARVRAACQLLRTTASGYGFPQLSDAARRVMQAMGDASSLDGCAQEMKRLESIAGRLHAARPSS